VTRNDARAILRVLLAAYPMWKLDDDGMKFWLGKLEKHDARIAAAVADEWTDTQKWPPSWHEVVALIKMADPRRLMNERSWRAYQTELAALAELGSGDRESLPIGTAAQITAGESARSAAGGDQPRLTSEQVTENKRKILRLLASVATSPERGLGASQKRREGET